MNLGKTCTTCGVFKTLEQFHKQTVGRLGRHAHCRSCKNADMRRRYGPGHTRRKKLRRWGLTEADFEACAICATTQRLVLDHDHKTMRLRGILCSNCNSALGLLGESADRVRAAAEYLRRVA